MSGPESSLLIKVTTCAGERHELQAVAGWRVMEIIRDYGLPIKAECGGACACGTCHVYVDPEWMGRLHAPLEDENERLADVWDRRENSRLACQIIMNDDLSGLAVTLADGTAP